MNTHRPHHTLTETRPVEIIDSTLREGQQSPLLFDFKKYYPTENNKRSIAEALMKYGVRFMEVFSPVVNGQECRDLPLIIGVRNDIQKETGQPIYILAHCRCHPDDVEKAIKAGVDGINFFIRTSDPSKGALSKETLAEIIGKVRPLIEKVHKNYPKLNLRFSGEDAFRTKLEDLFAVYDSIVEFVDRLGMPDTVGTAAPEMVAERVRTLKKRYPKVDLEGHFHNDRGFSLLNALSAIRAGMKYINTTLLGLGERSGITSMTALLFNLYLENPKLVRKFNLAASYPLNVLMADIMKMHVPSTEPVSLTNRTHSAGIHTEAMLRDPSLYEAHPLDQFGVSEKRLLLGPLSGWHVVHYYLNEVLYFVGVNEDMAKMITKEFKEKSSEIYKYKTPTKLLEEIARIHNLPQIKYPDNKPVEDLS